MLHAPNGLTHPHVHGFVSNRDENPGNLHRKGRLVSSLRTGRVWITVEGKGEDPSRDGQGMGTFSLKRPANVSEMEVEKAREDRERDAPTVTRITMLSPSLSTTNSNRNRPSS